MKVRFTADSFTITTELKKYANTKIAQLARKVPRRLRAGATCYVQFSQIRRKAGEFNTCSIRFIVDGAELKAEETTLHMYSSLDIAAVHVGHQLKDFVAKRDKRHLRTALRRYFRRRM